MTTPGGPALSPAVAALLHEAQRAEKSAFREISRRHYESALYLLRAEDAAVAPSIFRRIANTYIQDGQPDAALDCLAAAHALADLRGDATERTHAVILMGTANLSRGDIDTANGLYRRAQEEATAAGDRRLLAMVEANLGMVAGIRGNLEVALDHHASALHLHRAIGSDQYITVLNNLAMTYSLLERWDEAERAYDEALVHCDHTGDAATKLMVQVNLADMWIARGEWARAADLCQVVLVEASVADDQRSIGETYKHCGVIARARGDHDDSERQLARAYENAMRREDLLLAAETAREQAELYEVLGRNKDTLQALTLSYRLFGRLRAQRALADLSRRVGRLEDRFYVVVRRWAETIESKDPYTAGHCERVANYASSLARDTGVDDIIMFWFRIGALLHDVGKIVVPSEVLNKDGPLSDEERAIMQRHPEAGVELLRGIEFAWDILPMVRGHHERWDGTGYPDGLAGEGIPESARILAVADVFDALTSDRPYRRAFSREEALAMMAAESGRMFDPDLFARFARIVQAVEGRPTPLGVGALAVS
jgi:putative nucleotidyltransferase with HDIG domain